MGIEGIADEIEMPFGTCLCCKAIYHLLREGCRKRWVWFTAGYANWSRPRAVTKNIFSDTYCHDLKEEIEWVLQLSRSRRRWLNPKIHHCQTSRGWRRGARVWWWGGWRLRALNSFITLDSRLDVNTPHIFVTWRIIVLRVQLHSVDICPNPSCIIKIYYLNSGTQNSPGPYGFRRGQGVRHHSTLECKKVTHFRCQSCKTGGVFTGPSSALGSRFRLNALWERIQDLLCWLWG